MKKTPLYELMACEVRDRDEHLDFLNEKNLCEFIKEK